MLIRFFDITIAVLGILLTSWLMVILLIMGLFDTGKPLITQSRIGKSQRPFKFYKFRTMKLNTDYRATHLIDSAVITSWGRLLRKSKLDELPQLFNVLKGDMSIVGPRPCLTNQTELIFEREKRGIYNYLPGITGLGQLHHVDMSEPEKLAILDELMVKNLTTFHYFNYILATLVGKKIELKNVKTT